MRTIIVQYGGDYREAVYRFAAGQGETYHAQKYSVNSVAEIGRQIEEIAVLCCQTKVPYDELLPNGVRAIGAGFQDDVDFKAICKLIEAYQPTHLVLNMAVRAVAEWAIRHKIPTLCLLADSFSAKNLREWLRYYRLGRALNHPQIQWVGNHGIAACESLQAIGVSPNKIIPWDWPHPMRPDSFSPKQLSQPQSAWTLLYVGTVIESKGVGDALEAVSYLRSQDVPVCLKIAGNGNLEQFRQKVKDLNLSEFVEFLGVVENKSIIPLMRSADLVLVPSHHDYPEGFPLTIYEALCSRTPLVASDHPMFVRQLSDRVDSMLFPANNASALASQIKTVLTEPELYSKISEATQATWQRLQLPVKLGELLHRWINGSLYDEEWIFKYRFSSGLYNQNNQKTAS